VCTAANLGFEQIQNAISGHLQVVKVIGIGYFENSFFHLT
jgi:hypothetical protein